MDVMFRVLFQDGQQRATKTSYNELGVALTQRQADRQID